ncbi:MAG: hypothetical protein K0U98_25700 [Deltaproteobacteria bacterium]|nr:hypothetical protein [Deltaproteobacteria bacterium]
MISKSAFSAFSICLALSFIFALSALVPSPLQAGSASSEMIVDAMVEAHGGMTAWAEAPTVSWQDAFLPPGAPAPITAQITVEQGLRRAYADFPGTEMSFAWDGEKAWSQNWGLPFPPRFMALLNYHFLNLPWLAKDPGVHLGAPGVGKLKGDPTEYITVKITYGDGVGDTPKDYYILYIHPKTHQLKACSYIVTYRAILPEGMETSPQNTLIYDDFADVGGLLVPTQYTIYQADHSVYASATIQDWSFEKTFDEARMEMAEGAVVDTSQP